MQLLLTDIEGAVQYLNPVSEQLTGWSEKEASGKPLEKIFKISNEESRIKVENPVEKILRDGIVVGLANHTLLISRNGQEIPIADSGAPIKDDQGEITGVVLVFRDQTEERKAQQAIQEAKVYAESIVCTVREPLIVLDGELKVISANRTFYKTFQVDEKETVGDKIYNLGNRQWDIPKLREMLEEILPQNTSFNDFEVQHDFEHIGTRTMLLNARRIYREAHKTQMILLAIEDITERKQAEKLLEESEERFRQIFSNLGDAVFVIKIGGTDRGRIIEVNPAAEKQTGYTKSELLNMNIAKDISINESGDINHNEWDKKLINGNAVTSIEKKRRKDGTEYWTEVLVTPIEYKGKKASLSINRDITKRKQIEEELAKHRMHLEELVTERTDALNISLKDAENARDKIDTILKSVGDGLIVTDNNNNVILMNSAAEEIFDVHLNETVNRKIDYAIKDQTVREHVKDTLNKKTDYKFDFELPGKKQDNPQIFSARTSVITDKQGKLSGIVTIFHDVSYEREIDRMKTEFISTAAHELRTPLTSIQGFSEILLTRENLKKVEKNKFLTYINRQAENLTAIINDLLDLSRIESGRSFVLEKEPCSLHKIADEVVDIFKRQGKMHRFSSEFGNEPEYMYFDKDKIFQVFRNLISNSVKYSPGGGLIQIKGDIVQDYYQITVQDEGIGMSPDQVKKIFDKFYRADASNTAVEGTGLGMSIVKYIVEAHGGKVWVDSELNKGTIVFFTIPCVK